MKVKIFIHSIKKKITNGFILYLNHYFMTHIYNVIINLSIIDNIYRDGLGLVTFLLLQYSSSSSLICSLKSLDEPDIPFLIRSDVKYSVRSGLIFCLPDFISSIPAGTKADFSSI